MLEFCIDIEVIEHHHDEIPLMNRERMYKKRSVIYLLWTDIEMISWGRVTKCQP